MKREVLVRFVFVGLLILSVMILVGCTSSSGKSEQKSDIMVDSASEIVSKQPVENKVIEEKVEQKKEDVKSSNTSAVSEVKSESKMVSKPIVQKMQPGWGKSVTVTSSGSYMTVLSNGIPSHQVGVFPTMLDANADGRPDNPNTIKAQTYNYKISLAPKRASSTISLPMGPIGIALSGAVFFNPLNAEKQDAVQVEVFDMCQGHPEMQGRYHYHELSSCFEVGSEGHSFLIGYAFDGYGVYGPYEDTGVLAKGLDSCNGHEHGSYGYHYHATMKYPYLLGCYTGVVENSNLDQIGGKNMGSGSGAQMNGGQTPPPGQGPPPPPGAPLPK